MENQSFTTSKQVLVYIKDTFGLAVFSDEKKFLSYFSDLAPKLKQERKIILYLVNNGQMSQLVSVANHSYDKQKSFVDKYYHILLREFNDSSIVSEFMRGLLEVLDYQYCLDNGGAKQTIQPSTSKPINTSHSVPQVATQESTTTSPVIAQNELFNSFNGGICHFENERLRAAYLKICHTYTDVFGNREIERDSIGYITFLDSLQDAPSYGTWDVSAKKDKSILAWVDFPSLHSNSPPPDRWWFTSRHLYIASDGKIIAPQDSDFMFDRYHNLRRIDFGSCFDTSNVTSMGFMFAGCSLLTDLDVSHFDTSKVTHMGSMFKGCSSLTDLDVSHFDTSNVTSMGFMFAGCSLLSDLDVSHFDTSKVTHMNSMFQDCWSLSSLDVSHFNTSNVAYMNSMFAGCSSLTDLDVSHFDTSKVTYMDSMFKGCSALPLKSKKVGGKMRFLKFW